LGQIPERTGILSNYNGKHNRFGVLLERDLICRAFGFRQSENVFYPHRWDYSDSRPFVRSARL
jgi:hypothetical protein